MSIDIHATNVKLWVNRHEYKGDTFNTYAISISRKGQDGNYINKSVKVVFGKDVYVPADIQNGAVMDFGGFPSINVYKDKEGREHREVQFFITKAEFKENGAPSVQEYMDIEPQDSFAVVEDDIPFK